MTEDEIRNAEHFPYRSYMEPRQADDPFTNRPAPQPTMVWNYTSASNKLKKSGQSMKSGQLKNK